MSSGELEKVFTQNDEEMLSASFITTCACGSDNHRMIMDLEYDKKNNSILLSYYIKLIWSCYWSNYTWAEQFWRKMKAIYNLMFHNFIEMDTVFIFRGKEHLVSMRDEITTFINEIEK